MSEGRTTWSNVQVESLERHLPCDVMLPPDQLIRKGVPLEVLIDALLARTAFGDSENRFNDPAALKIKPLPPFEERKDGCRRNLLRVVHRWNRAFRKKHHRRRE